MSSLCVLSSPFFCVPLVCQSAPLSFPLYLSVRLVCSPVSNDSPRLLVGITLFLVWSRHHWFVLCFLVVLCSAFVFSTSVFWHFCTPWLLDYTIFGFQLFIKAHVFVLSPACLLCVLHLGPHNFLTISQWWDRKRMTLSPWSSDLVQVEKTPLLLVPFSKKTRLFFLIPFYHHARNNAKLISYEAPLPSERLIHCCFAFRNLYLCQSGLLNRTFYHQRRSPGRCQMSLRATFSFESMRAIWPADILYWPFNKRFITDHFSLPSITQGSARQRCLVPS